MNARELSREEQLVIALKLGLITWFQYFEEIRKSS